MESLIIKYMVATIGDVEAWIRDDHMMKNGWAPFTDACEPIRAVADACAKLVSETHKLK